MDRVLFKAPLNLPCSTGVIPLGMSAGISWDWTTRRTHEGHTCSAEHRVSFLWENEQGTNLIYHQQSVLNFHSNSLPWGVLEKMCIVLLPNSSSLTMNTTNIWSGNLVLMWNNLRFLDINSRLLLVIKNMWHSSRVPSPAIVSRGLHDSLAVQPGLPNDVGAHAWSLARWHNLGASQLSSSKPKFDKDARNIWLRVTENLGVQKYRVHSGVKVMPLHQYFPPKKTSGKKQQT